MQMLTNTQPLPAVQLLPRGMSRRKPPSLRGSLLSTVMQSACARMCAPRWAALGTALRPLARLCLWSPAESRDCPRRQWWLAWQGRRPLCCLWASLRQGCPPLASSRLHPPQPCLRSRGHPTAIRSTLRSTLPCTSSPSRWELLHLGPCQLLHPPWGRHLLGSCSLHRHQD